MRIDDLEYLSEINEMAGNCLEKLVEQSEKHYAKQLDRAAQSIFADRKKRIVMLAGPSASGKTTTAGLLVNRLEALGAKAFTVSLDDFYHERRDVVVDENGKPDYESVRSLDVELIDSCLDEIIFKGSARMPRFDFISGRRVGFSEEITLGEDDVLIVEGIHALNPEITDGLPQDSLAKLYVSVSTRIVDNGGEVLMTKRDLRFVRRLVRDYHHRASSVERTYDLWGGVLRGEDKYIFPYSTLAEIKIDSFHPYEPCVFRTLAEPMLKSVQPDSAWYPDACAMLKKLSLFVPVSANAVPEKSLLNEFIK